MAIEDKLIKSIDAITAMIGEHEAGIIETLLKKGITTRQFIHIDTIHRLGHPNFRELAEALNLSKPSVTAIVEKLISTGYVAKFRSQSDRRSFTLHLTDQGKEVVSMHDAVHRSIARIFTGTLNQTELKRLVEIMEKVIRKSNTVV